MDVFDSNQISCKPLSNLSDLLDWPKLKEKRRQYCVDKLDLSNIGRDPNEPQVIVCHDMRNNYLEDRYFQGHANTPTCYNFYHWPLVDIFIYFSHHFVTIPPESWINAAHKNSTRMLGTFITEFDNGEKICNAIFDEQNLNRVIQNLVDITLFYGFDGWLLNIENKIENVEKLKYFVQKLNSGLKKIDPDLYKVIWYDSVTDKGELKWQNELNDLNKPFFDISDG